MCLLGKRVSQMQTVVTTENIESINNDSGNNYERYTPELYVSLVCKVFGAQIDLDPASCSEANETVRARRFFTKEQDGLKQSWEAENIFLNPPYNNMFPWVEKLISELEVQPTTPAILLCNLAISTKWFELICKNTRAGLNASVCLVNHRIKFLFPKQLEVERKKQGKRNLPTKENMFVCFGSNEIRKKFTTEFGNIAKVLEL